ncbi:MAG TPA: (2Fe-2S)-binding protein [Thermoanaerobaculia bacterium]|nr:(2Fe-2S)-binding protein [Thermoanaerobaculia bacterium]
MSDERESPFELVVDGRRYPVDADPETPLLWVLRDRLGKTGPKYGCGLGVCGACTVLEGDTAVRSCRLSLGEAAGRSFVTLEGLDPRGEHPVQRAWLEEDVSQCGYCQGGMILETVALLARNPHPTDDEIAAGLYGVLCRCGTYARVIRAVRRAAELSDRTRSGS